MTYDYAQRKITAVLADGLLPGQALNVLGHLCITLGANRDSRLMGREILHDASGGTYKGIARYGLIVKKASSAEIAQLVLQAKEKSDLTVIDYPREMLDTKHDDDLDAALSEKAADDLEYLGCVIYGEAGSVNALTNAHRLWS